MTDVIGRTVILDLVPTTIRLLVDVEKGEDEKIVLVGEMKLKSRESMKLSTEEDFEKLEGIFRLVDTGEKDDDDKPIGVFYYCKESESLLEGYHIRASYTLDVQIPRRRFDALLAAVSQGRLPSGISIKVAGMSYDWQPDGSGKIWDNKSAPQLPIASIKFYVPIIGGDPHDLLDARNAEDSVRPSRAQINQVASSLDELKGALQSMHRTLVWIMILMVLLFVTYMSRFG